MIWGIVFFYFLIRKLISRRLFDNSNSVRVSLLIMIGSAILFIFGYLYLF